MVGRRRASAVGRAAVLVVVGLALSTSSGCNSSEEDEARDVVKDYARAIADGDERKICETLSRDSIRQFADGGTNCEKAYKNFGAYLNGEQKNKLREIDPDVTVDGNSASTEVNDPPLEGMLRLTEEGGEWKIST